MAVDISKQLAAILSEELGETVLNAIQSAEDKLNESYDTDISEELAIINNGVYGRDIRKAIYDSLYKLSLAGPSEKSSSAVYGTSTILANGVLSSNVLYGTAQVAFDETRIAVVLLDENDDYTFTITYYDNLSDSATYVLSHSSNRYFVNIGSKSETTSINSACFKDCTSLAGIRIPSSVTTIGSIAFSGCTGLDLVDIPSSVTSIGSNAFSGTTCTVVINNTQNGISGSPWGTTSDKIVWNNSNVTIYSFRVNKNDPDPSTRVQYLYDAVDKTPAHMNTNTGEFDYGDWKDAWFITGNKPVALLYDGTVDYELDPDDYTKKKDGTASDVSSASYAGNFMASIPLCWVYRFEGSKYRYYMIADRQAGDGFKAYAHTDATGTVKSVFYAPMFKGIIQNNTLRSIKGVMPGSYAQYANEIAAAQACGTGWQIWDWAKHELIADLLTLISKSTDSQGVFGDGNTNSVEDSTNYGKLVTGSSGSGQFWGGTDQQQVKVFHIEGFWGDRRERCIGLNLVNGVYTYKMVPPYSMTPDATYTSSDISISSTKVGIISGMRCGEFGSLPIAFDGSSTTYECDIAGVNSGITTGLFFGGPATCKKDAGMRYLDLSVRYDNYGYTMGASPVYC